MHIAFVPFFQTILLRALYLLHLGLENKEGLACDFVTCQTLFFFRSSCGEIASFAPLQPGRS